MKFLVTAVLLSLAIAIQAGSYSDRYDNINVAEILGNKRLLTAYIKCVLEEGKCTAEGKELKSHITDALQTGCTKCTGAQRKGIRRVIKHLIDSEPGYWDRLVDMYDPKRVYTGKYEKELRTIKA
ncbi:allergen Tha p 1-like [Bombyx mandarina]|uniref:Uncharacterized protein n=3 Tax=Bombyx TaxID=7090 RepID=A0A8R2M3D5_BOMMO|nr:allergen Tha p 1-like [Bombyx mandarina]XP_037873515.1 allergen Tha p 1 [Bombyx mori]